MPRIRYYVEWLTWLMQMLHDLLGAVCAGLLVLILSVMLVLIAPDPEHSLVEKGVIGLVIVVAGVGAYLLSKDYVPKRRPRLEKQSERL